MKTKDTKDLKEELMNAVTNLMENHVKSVVGEDGLTVWDFADLRDAFIEYQISALTRMEESTREFKKGETKRIWHMQGVKDGKREAREEIVEKAMWCQFCGDELECFGCQMIPGRTMTENRKLLLESLKKEKTK